MSLPTKRRLFEDDLCEDGGGDLAALEWSLSDLDDAPASFFADFVDLSPGAAADVILESPPRCSFRPSAPKRSRGLRFWSNSEISTYLKKHGIRTTAARDVLERRIQRHMDGLSVPLRSKLGYTMPAPSCVVAPVASQDDVPLLFRMGHKDTLSIIFQNLLGPRDLLALARTCRTLYHYTKPLLQAAATEAFGPHGTPLALAAAQHLADAFAARRALLQQAQPPGPAEERRLTMNQVHQELLRTSEEYAALAVRLSCPSLCHRFLLNPKRQSHLVKRHLLGHAVPAIFDFLRSVMQHHGGPIDALPLVEARNREQREALQEEVSYRSACQSARLFEFNRMLHQAGLGAWSLIVQADGKIAMAHPQGCQTFELLMGQSADVFFRQAKAFAMMRKPGGPKLKVAAPIQRCLPRLVDFLSRDCVFPQWLPLGDAVRLFSPLIHQWSQMVERGLFFGQPVSADFLERFGRYLCSADFWLGLSNTRLGRFYYICLWNSTHGTLRLHHAREEIPGWSEGLLPLVSDPVSGQLATPQALEAVEYAFFTIHHVHEQ